MTLSVRKILDAQAPVGFTARPLDEAECRAGGYSVDAAINQSLALSVESFALECPDGILCLWGYRPRSFLCGGVDMWLLSSEIVNDRPIAFGRETKRVCESLLADWGSISCTVWKGHNIALAWLYWLGFSADGISGDFVLMRRERT